MYRKNVAGQFLCIAAVKTADGTALTGATVSIRRCIDGTFAAGGATITEDTGLGFYKVALTQADTNGNNISYFFTATGMVPVCVNIVTTAADPTDTVRFGLTALPNVASGSAGAIITSGTGTAQLSVSSGLVTLAGVTHTGAVIPTVTTVTNQLTAAAIATGVWQDATAGDFTAAGSIGKSIMNGVALGTGLTVNDITTKTGYSLTAGTGLGNQTSNITGNLSGSVGSVTGSVGSVAAAVSTTDFTTQLTESYRANGAAPTPAQALCEILAHLGETSISGTTKTIKKLDHSTTAGTFTLDSATTPSAITRAT